MSHPHSTFCRHFQNTAFGQRYPSPIAPRRVSRQPRPYGWQWANVREKKGKTPDFDVSSDQQSAKLARLEACLFLSKEPISTRKLAILAKLADGTEARTLLKVLAKRYDEGASALQVVDVAGGVQLLTRDNLSEWIRRLHGGNEELRLSGPAVETLAVVAYRQPVLRVEIEAIRGVQCGEILRVLMERDLLRIVGRSDELGRPFLYGTTKRFLQVFGLRRLEQLPPLDQIQNVGTDF